MLKLWDNNHVKSYYSSITIYVYEIYDYNYYVIQIDSTVQT